MTNLNRNSQELKVENDFVKRKQLESTNLVCELRSV